MKTRISLLKTYVKNPVQGSSQVAPSEEESIYLSPKEKFKEVQKQDWQIEALIIGSVILGLTQLPGIIHENYLDISDIFGSQAKSAETLLNVPFGTLLVSLITVIVVRSFWVVEAFGSRNIHKMNSLNEIAGNYFGSGLLFFLILLCNSSFWICLSFFLSEFKMSFEFLMIIPSIASVLSFMIYPFSRFLILIGDIQLGTRFMKGFLICSNPLIYFIFLKRKWIYIESNLLTRHKYSHTVLGLEAFSLFMNLFFFIYLFNITVDKYSPAISSFSSPIRIEDERIADHSLWLFVHASALDKTSSGAGVYFGENESVAKKKIDMGFLYPDANKVRLLINGKRKTYEWRLNYQNVGSGLKTYLKSSDMRKGFNDIRLKTYRDGIWRVWDFSVYKP